MTLPTYSYVDLIKRDGLQDGQLAAFHVQREVVDGRVVERLQDGVQGDAGHIHLEGFFLIF